MRLLSGLVLTVALLPTACGDDGTAESCIEVREPLDPLSIQHVIDPEAVTFQTDPPTSGPHLSGPSVEGKRSPRSHSGMVPKSSPVAAAADDGARVMKAACC